MTTACKARAIAAFLGAKELEPAVGERPAFSGQDLAKSTLRLGTIAFSILSAAATADNNDYATCSSSARDPGSASEAVLACNRFIATVAAGGKQITDPGEIKRIAQAYAMRGIATLTQHGDFDEVIADETMAIQLDPDVPLAFLIRGRAYIEQKQYEKAVADEAEAIRLDPQDWSAYDNRGVAYAQSGDYAKAFADFQLALRLIPTSDQFVPVLQGRIAKLEKLVPAAARAATPPLPKNISPTNRQ